LSEATDPLTRRLRQITKDAANAVAGALVLYTGLRESKRPRQVLGKELAALRQQMQQVERAAGDVDGFLEMLERKASESSEAELITIVERLADAVQVDEGMRQLRREDYITCARRVFDLLPNRIPLTVKEVASHKGGRGQLELWRDEINKILEETNV
jgi:hypothetical protein